jgi:hypothetical protein
MGAHCGSSGFPFNRYRSIEEDSIAVSAVVLIDSEHCTSLPVKFGWMTGIVSKTVTNLPPIDVALTS